MTIIVNSTNLYGAWKLGNGWKPVTITEICHFIAIIIFMSVVKQPEMCSYWYSTTEHADVFGREFVKNLMGRDRFTLIWGSIHFIDVTGLDKEGRKEASKKDGFYLVRPFLDMIRESCERYCLPGRGLSIDEMCIWFKGRHRCRCFNPNKPEKWHLKFYNMNDPDTGYCMNFIPYQGKDEQLPEGISATLWPVRKLTENRDLWFKNRTIATDNWYTSMKVVKLCFDRGFHFVGTCKTNVSGIPKHGLLPKKVERGTMVVHRAEIDGRDNKKYPVYFTGWFDNRPVYVLSSFEVRIDKVVRKVKAAKEPYHEKELAFPTAIGVYNRLMGGTDAGDQKAVYYRYEHQTRKWPHRIFTHMLNFCIVNAHILYCWQNPKITLLEFTIRVMKSLATVGQVEEEVEEVKEVIKAPKPDKKMYSKTAVLDVGVTQNRMNPNLGHYPISSVKRAICGCCGVRTTLKCGECDQNLCTNGKGLENCFWRWHNLISPTKEG
jgi:hypothetical protein